MEWNDLEGYAQVLAKKNENPTLKVILSIGGWTHGTQKFSLAAASSTSRQTFATNALQFITSYGFDGLDIDWEHPKGQDVAKFPLFLETLRDTFPDNLLLTAAMVAPPYQLAAAYPQTARICNALNYVHLMTYDFHGGWESVIGHNSPWTSDGSHPNDPASSFTVKASVKAWIAAGCPAEKLTIGLASYGRVFEATTNIVERTNPGVVANAGQYTGEQGFYAYYEICNMKNIFINPDIQSAVATDGSRWVGFETVESALVKLSYIVDHDMAGTMWWTLDLDDFSGLFCNSGKYPLIRGVKEKLDEMSIQGSVVEPVTDAPKVVTIKTVAVITDVPETDAPETPKATIIPADFIIPVNTEITAEIPTDKTNDISSGNDEDTTTASNSHVRHDQRKIFYSLLYLLCHLIIDGIYTG